MPARSGPFPDIRRMNAHLQSPLFPSSRPLVTQNTPDRHNRDRSRPRVTQNTPLLDLSALILVTGATCTQSLRITVPSCNEGISCDFSTLALDGDARSFFPAKPIGHFRTVNAGRIHTDRRVTIPWELSSGVERTYLLPEVGERE